MRKGECVKISGMLLFFIGLLFLSSQTTWAEYPDKPITAIQCWSAGGQIDITTRALATPASKILGQQIIIETRPGGSGGVGIGLLKTRKADGYNIGVTTISTLIHQHLNKVPYDLIKDFTPIMQYSDGAYCIAVAASSPWKSVQDLLDYAKANPGKIRISSSGPGDPGGFLTMSALADRFKLDWTHVPFVGGMPAVAALLGGHVEVYSGALGNAAPNVKAGKLRLLAILTEKRWPNFPEVPNLKELGIPIVAPSFSAIFAPKGLPPDILEILHQGLRKAMDDPDFKKSLEVTDKGWVYRSPQEFAKDLAEVDQEIRRIVRQMKMKQKKE